jgi:replicative DNA helicase
MNKSLPNCEDAERELLGSVLVDPSCLERVGDVDPAFFYKRSNGVLFSAMKTVYERTGAVDLTVLREEMRASGDWDKHYGLGALNGAMDRCGLSAHAPYYAELVRKKHVERLLVGAGREIERIGFTTYDLDDAVMGAQGAIDKVKEQAAASAETPGVARYIDTVLRIQSGEEPAPRVTTGIAPLDVRLGGGWKAGWQCVVVAPSGHGKTALSIGNFALAAARSGKGVLICSLEMPPGEVWGRLIAAISGVPVHIHDRPGMAGLALSRMVKAADELNGLPIEVVGSDFGSAAKIHARAQATKARLGSLGLVIVDYLQLMRSPVTRKDSTKEEEISANSACLKRMAMDLETTTIVLSQPTASAKRSGSMPTVSDSKGSGAIEDDCDVALTPWLPSKVCAEASSGAAKIGMSKFRHGPQRSLTETDVRWIGSSMRFEATEVVDHAPF